MAAATSIAIGASIALSAGGAYLQYQGQRSAAKANQQVLQSQKAVEEQRRRAMELDATRRRREVYRNMIQARSQALSNATQKGAGFSSGLQGGYGEIAGRTGVNDLGIMQNAEIGSSIFDANAQGTSAYGALARAQGTIGLGAGISSLGAAITQNLGAINSLSQGRNFSGGMGTGYTGYTSYGDMNPWGSVPMAGRHF